MCVEPNPPTFALLERNLAGLAAPGPGEFVQAAVWSADMALTGSAPAEGYSRYRTRPPEPRTSSTIPGIPIESLIQKSGFDVIDLLKVDVEGAEVELFRGDTSGLDRVNGIAIEFHDDSRRECGFEVRLNRHNRNERTPLTKRGRP